MNNDFPSIYLLAPLFGWLAAHAVKYVLQLIKSGGKAKSLGIFMRAGGMPSSHTAVMTALATVICVRQGVGSAVFGLCVTVAAIIMYDAVNVRRSVGEQADVLKKVAVNTNNNKQFYVAYGHTITEVVVGVIVGLAVGFIMLQIL